MNWLTSPKLEHREQRSAYEEMLLTVRQSRERVERLKHTKRDAVADWSSAPAVAALQALRGIDLVTAAASRRQATRARKLLIEAAWSSREGVSKEAAPRSAREIDWKAQIRLCSRFRTLTKKGKRSTVVVIAIARELTAFIWAISRETVEWRAAPVL